MFSFICGKIVSVDGNTVVINNNDIGYELIVSATTLVKCYDVGDNVQLYTYMQLRDDGITLYGFATEQEKRMFLRLLSVSGVGCKVAINVLSKISINDLAVAIVSEDTSALCSIKGLGKKTAERIILELKEKIPLIETFVKSNSDTPLGSNAEDAVTVLVSLGLNKGDALARVKTAVENGEKATQDILNFALKNI
ncbi:MAG: Holliday junction branch migration protein RuvA [Clostridia bacterium]